MAVQKNLYNFRPKFLVNRLRFQLAEPIEKFPVVVCPKDEKLAIGFRFRDTLTITPATKIVIKMMSFKKIFKHFFNVQPTCSGIDTGSYIRSLLWPEQMS